MPRIIKNLSLIMITLSALSSVTGYSATQNTQNTQGQSTDVTAHNPLNNDYTQKMDTLTRDLQLTQAENAILAEQLKAAKLHYDMNTIGDNASGSVRQSLPVNQSDDITHIPQKRQLNRPFFQLERITGALSHPSAWIYFNGTIAEVKKGDKLVGNWSVKSISPNSVIIVNDTFNETKQLYLASQNTNNKYATDTSKNINSGQ